MKANQEHLAAVQALRFAVLAMIALGAPLAPAATLGNGTLTNFRKAALADPMQPASQHRRTPNVWLTRASTAGLDNAKTEAGSGGVGSPADPENTASKTTT